MLLLGLKAEEYGKLARALVVLGVLAVIVVVGKRSLAQEGRAVHLSWLGFCVRGHTLLVSWMVTLGVCFFWEWWLPTLSTGRALAGHRHAVGGRHLAAGVQGRQEGAGTCVAGTTFFLHLPVTAPSSPLPFQRHRGSRKQRGWLRSALDRARPLPLYTAPVCCLDRSRNISTTAINQCLWRRRSSSSHPVHVQVVCHPPTPHAHLLPHAAWKAAAHTQHAVQHHHLLQPIDCVCVGGGTSSTPQPQVEWVLALGGTHRRPPLVRNTLTTAPVGEKPHPLPTPLSQQPHACKIKPPHACSRVPPTSPAAAAAAAKPAMQQECKLASRHALSSARCAQQDSLCPPAAGSERTETSNVNGAPQPHRPLQGLCRGTHGGGLARVALCTVLQQQRQRRRRCSSRQTVHMCVCACL